METNPSSSRGWATLMSRHVEPRATIGKRLPTIRTTVATERHRAIGSSEVSGSSRIWHCADSITRPPSPLGGGARESPFLGFLGPTDQHAFRNQVSEPVDEFETSWLVY